MFLAILSSIVPCHYIQNILDAYEHCFVTVKAKRPDIPHNRFKNLFPFFNSFVSFFNCTSPCCLDLLLKGKCEKTRKQLDRREDEFDYGYVSF